MSIGVDEVGRGPLAGPVVAAAVHLTVPIVGLKDSKQLSLKRREALALEIQSQCPVGIGWASVEEIDALNILQASLLAMLRAFEKLGVTEDNVIIDGNRVPADFPAGTRAVIGGDKLIPAVSAASIVAKVYRDQWIARLDEQFPEYGFSQHKGYPTALHLQKLALHGPCIHHRKSFGPVAKYLETCR